MITDQLCYGCGSKEHKIQRCNKKKNLFVTNNERNKKKEEEMRGIMEDYGQVKSLKLRFHPNNKRNKSMICFSYEKEASYNRNQHLQRMESKTLQTIKGIKRI